MPSGPFVRWSVWSSRVSGRRPRRRGCLCGLHAWASSPSPSPSPRRSRPDGRGDRPRPERAAPLAACLGLWAGTGPYTHVTAQVREERSACAVHPGRTVCTPVRRGGGGVGARPRSSYRMSFEVKTRPERGGMLRAWAVETTCRVAGLSRGSGWSESKSSAVLVIGPGDLFVRCGRCVASVRASPYETRAARSRLFCSAAA